MFKLQNIASAHLHHKRSCGLLGGCGHSELISEATHQVETMHTAFLRTSTSIPSGLIPWSHHLDRKDRVSFHAKE